MPEPARTRLNTGGRPIANSWRTAHARAWSDLKARWRRGLLWTLYLVVFLGLIVSLWFAVRWTHRAKIFDRPDTSCLPDGRFSLSSDDYDYWTASGFFDITMGFGELTFTQAKVIDVIWDVVVGRGGQALLALVSWNVFAKYVTTTMRVAPITFDTFRTFFLYRDRTTAFSVTRLVHDFSRRRSLPSRCAMIYMIVTMMFILAFPTFGSAMTGYKSNVQAFVQDRSRSYVPFSNFKFLYYTIHDGDRINLTRNFGITDFRNSENPVILPGEHYWDWSGSRYGDTDCRGSGGKPCDLVRQVDDYVIKYGVGGATNTATSFGMNQTSLPAPSLNITGYYIPWRDGPTTVRGPGGSSIDLTDLSRLAWSNDNGSAAYVRDYIQQYGACQQTKTYQWGFSFIQLILMICLLLAWAIGLYVLYMSSHIALLKTGGEDEHAPGDYMAILHLANAINDQLSHENGGENVEKSEVAVLGEEELKHRIDKDLKGGTISYKDSLLDNADTRSRAVRPWNFMKWIQKEMAWILLLLLAIVGVFLTAGFFPYLIVPYLAPLLILFAWHVGQTGKTRVVLLFWPMLVFGVVPTVILVQMIFTVRRH